MLVWRSVLLNVQSYHSQIFKVYFLEFLSDRYFNWILSCVRLGNIVLNAFWKRIPFLKVLSADMALNINANFSKLAEGSSDHKFISFNIYVMFIWKTACHKDDWLGHTIQGFPRPFRHWGWGFPPPHMEGTSTGGQSVNGGTLEGGPLRGDIDIMGGT